MLEAGTWGGEGRSGGGGKDGEIGVFLGVGVQGSRDLPASPSLR